MAMSKAERKARFEVAIEIMQTVYNDMCKAPFEEVSREQTYEFCCLLQDMYKFSSTLSEKNTEQKD